MQPASITITLLALVSGALAGVASTANYDPGLNIFKRQSDDALCEASQGRCGSDCGIIGCVFTCLKKE
ncbi:hypothetical protein PG993_007145 [Apiospora rasikravindrae]|uniref:Uncharacterized protein n=1 Tax=Apiospora rasikravindrae TaxID=990691 RepID=A0ABR1SYG4_9PEZI